MIKDLARDSLVIETSPEPVDFWEMAEYEGQPTLSTRYQHDSMNNQNAAFQLKIIRSLLHRQRDINEAKSEGKFIFVERAFYDTIPFIKAMRAEKSLDPVMATELELMVATLDKTLSQPDLAFNLICDLDTAQSRIAKRNRPSECNGIGRDYLGYLSFELFKSRVQFPQVFCDTRQRTSREIAGLILQKTENLFSCNPKPCPWDQLAPSQNPGECYSVSTVIPAGAILHEDDLFSGYHLFMGEMLHHHQALVRRGFLSGPPPIPEPWTCERNSDVTMVSVCSSPVPAVGPAGVAVGAEAEGSRRQQGVAFGHNPFGFAAQRAALPACGSLHPEALRQLGQPPHRLGPEEFDDHRGDEEDDVTICENRWK